MEEIDEIKRNLKSEAAKDRKLGTSYKYENILNFIY